MSASQSSPPACGYATFALPGDPAALTGGYIYDARIVDGLRRRGWTIDLLPLGDGFPFPDDATEQAASLALCRAAARGPVIVDGLALGVLPEAAVQVADRSSLIALVHHPLALESGTPVEAMVRLMETERQSLVQAHVVIATSATTAAIVERDYRVAPDKVFVARPGVTPRSRFDRKTSTGALQLLSVAAISPRKGFPDLVAALSMLADVDWRLTIAGDRMRNRGASAELIGQIDRLGLSKRIDMPGTVSEAELDALYRNADVFVLASLFEGYGMAYAEAIAHGLPVIGTTGGAIAETVPAEAAILVAPGDVASLSIALRQVLNDHAKRKAMSEAAWDAASLLPTWEQAVTVFDDALQRLEGRIA